MKMQRWVRVLSACIFAVFAVLLVFKGIGAERVRPLSWSEPDTGTFDRELRLQSVKARDASRRLGIDGRWRGSDLRPQGTVVGKGAEADAFDGVYARALGL